MKKQLLTAILSTAGLTGFAQVAEDSVELGAGYTHQVWYSLANDEQGKKPLADWDLAFETKSIYSSIYVNTANDVKVWCYPKADISGWNNVDTTGINTWQQRYNSDTSWTYFGALGRYADPNNPADLDWGVYNTSTHVVMGDSIYIIQLANGNYKKLVILKLQNGQYDFKYANLDGSNEVTTDVKKSDYTTKKFGYYSLQNDQELDLAPQIIDWDLLFTKYTAFVPSAYNVTGVLHNEEIRMEEVTNVANVATYKDHSKTPGRNQVNTIGYDWKSFNMGTMQYDIKDSLCYFAHLPSGAIWKLVFTGFESGTGKIKFSKEKLVGVSVNDIEGKNLASVAVYPNPATGSHVTIVYDHSVNNKHTTLQVTDMTGRTVHTAVLNNQVGLHQYHLPVTGMAAGVYLLTVSTDNGNVTQRLVTR